MTIKSQDPNQPLTDQDIARLLKLEIVPKKMTLALTEQGTFLKETDGFWYRIKDDA